MSTKKHTIAILVGAGKSLRFNQSLPKQYIPIIDQSSAFEIALEAFINNPVVDYVLPVINIEHQHYYKKILERLSDKFLGIDIKLLPFCVGGMERKDSVYAALKIIDVNVVDKVLIHDVARPFVSQKIITSTILNIAPRTGIAPAIAVVDTVKRASNHFVYEELDRNNMHLLQTPQGFRYEDLMDSYKKFSYLNLSDDTSYLLKNNMQVKIIEGDIINSKITFYEDINFLSALYNMQNRVPKFDNIAAENSNKVKKQSGVLIGQGIDIHEFSSSPEDNQDLFLGGIKILNYRGLKGHSDADVVLHALVDAILGALGEGDIGDHFPPSNPSFKAAPSKIFLEFTRDLLYRESVYINNIDITILAEEPKINQYKQAMRENIAYILGIDFNLINIKATTAEKLGFIGRKEGITATAVVSLYRE